MQRLRVLISTAALAAATLIVMAGAAPSSPGAPHARVEPGGRFTPMKVRALVPDRRTPRQIDLASILGARPIVVCYFVVGEPFGEEGLVSLIELAEGDLKGKVEFLGATKVGGRISLAAVSERQSLLGVSFPLIVEEDFALGTALGAGMAPSISLIDAAGVLRIADGKSLRQEVAPGQTLAQAIRKAALRVPVPTVGKLPRYYPANELVGEPFPDFILKRFKGTERLRLSEVVSANAKAGKVTALFFWHPNCKHCKVVMPSIITGYNSYRRWLDIVSVTDLKNADEARNAEDTIRAHKMVFPVLEDEGRRVTEMCKVVSTPTLFFIRPDGRVDSVYTSGEADYTPIISARIRSILGLKTEPPAGG